MAPSHLSSSSGPPSGRCPSFAEREEIALWRAQGLGVREVARQLGRSGSTVSRELRRNAATRGGNLDCRATTAQWHAERAARRPKPAKLAVNATLRTYVQDRLAGVVVDPGRGRGGRSGRALEGSPAWATAEPAAGCGMEPAADCPAPAARLSRGRDHADQPRGHLPGALHTRPGSAEARADGLPAHRTGAARAAGAYARAGQVVRRPGGPHRRTPGRGGQPRSAGSLGGGPHPGPRQFRHRHPRRAHDAVHDAASPVANGGSRHGRSGEKRPRARRARGRSGARRDCTRDHDLAGAVAPIADLGPGSRGGAARPVAG